MSTRSHAPARARRRLVAALGVPAALVALSAALPFLLSLPAARRLVLAQFNRRAPGRLEVASWSLGWRRGIRLEGVSYEAPDRGLSAAAERVRVATPLWRLWPGPPDLGQVAIVRPDVKVRLPRKQPESRRAPRRSPDQRRPPASGDGPSARPPTPARQPLLPRGRIDLREGRLTLHSPGGRDVVLGQLAATCDLPQGAGPARFTFFAAAAAGGSLAGRGALEPAGASPDAGPLPRGTISVQLNALDLAPWWRVAATGPLWPEIAGGRLDADLTARLGPEQTVGLTGLVAVASLELGGKALRGDTPSFDRVEADLDVGLQAGSISIRRLVLTSPVLTAAAAGDLTPGGKGLPPSGNLAGNATLKLAPLAARFPATLRLQPGLVVEDGTLRVAASAQSTGEGLAFNGRARTASIAARRGGRDLRLETPVAIDVAGSADAGGVALEAVSLSSTFAELEGAGSRDDMRFQGHIDLAAALGELRKFVDLKQFDAAGGLALSGRLRREGAGGSAPVPRLDLTLQATDLRCSPGRDWTWEEPSASLALALAGNPLAGPAAVQRLLFEAATLSLSATGRVAELKGAGKLDLRGELACDLRRAGRLLALTTGRQIEMAGRISRPYRLATALGAGSWTNVLRATEAELGLGAERVVLFGVTATNVDLSATVTAGLLAGTLSAGAHGGAVRARPTVDARGARPVLTLPPGSNLLENVALGQSIAADLLARIHPLFHGCVVNGGRMSLRLDECRLPLDAAMKEDMALSGEVALVDVTLTAGSLLDSVLGLARVEDRTVSIPTQSVVWECRRGRVVTQPLKVSVEGYDLILSGSTGLDGGLDYRVQVPVNPKMVSSRIYPYVKDARLTVAIGGTVDRPRPSRDSFRETLGDLVREATRNLAVEGLGNLLDGFLQGR